MPLQANPCPGHNAVPQPERGVEGASSMLPPVTFLVHCLTVLINSEITMSTHFRQGSLIFFTCFFTMVSKAMSGVKRPVLNTQGRGQDKAGGGGEGARRMSGYTRISDQAPPPLKPRTQGWEHRTPQTSPGVQRKQGCLAPPQRSMEGQNGSQLDSRHQSPVTFPGTAGLSASGLHFLAVNLH